MAALYPMGTKRFGVRRGECAENVLLRDRVESEWTSIVKVALGDAKSDILPRAQENPKILPPLKKLAAPATTVDLDDEIPF